MYQIKAPSSCPTCGTVYRILTATYQRTLQDKPIHGKQTFLHADLYKYSCMNPSCSLRIFKEPLSFARLFQIRTDAFSIFILGIAIFFSNKYMIDWYSMIVPMSK
ncbi:transposase family protein [Enterococcus avium]|uniref:Transposase family protein n=1 Tax=Enterococcus avium TaxID=33945 RepID=A0A437US92_ENTAV|nr:transposase family protein [Enterococcus avium]